MGDGKGQMRLYLISVLGICWVLGIAAAFSRGNVIYQILQKGFTAFPVIAPLFTRRITGDKSEWHISFRIWKNKKQLGERSFYGLTKSVLRLIM